MTTKSEDSVVRRIVLHDCALVVCLVTVFAGAKLHHPSFGQVLPLGLLFALSYVTIIGNRR